MAERAGRENREYVLRRSSGLPDDIRETIAIGNLKTVAEQSSVLSNLAYANLISNDNLSQQNGVSNQQAMSYLSITVAGKANNLVTQLSPLTAQAMARLDMGNDIATQLAEIKEMLRALRR